MDSVSSQKSPFRVLSGTNTSHRLLILCVSIFVGIAVGLLSVAEASAADIIRVKTVAAGSGDGTSWDNAATLQNALQNFASSGDEVWVATGIYTPGITVGDTFELPAGVGVYGGFIGDETDRAQRDWESNSTVLSGDIGGDDSVDANGVVTDTDNIVGDNSFHVVSADGTSTPITGATVLDGFTVTAGRAQHELLDSSGGGLLCNGANGECSPSITNVVFSANTAEEGGAIYNDGGDGGNSSPNLTNVEFSANEAEEGGAIYNDGGDGGNASPNLTNVTFSANKAYNGGAMLNNGVSNGNSNPILSNVVFVVNEAYNGGAMYNDGSSNGNSNPVLSNVILVVNEAEEGGAIYNDGGDGGNASPNLTNVILSANTATNYGGAIYSDGGNHGNSSPLLTSVTFSVNRADNGGAMYNKSRYQGNSNPNLINVAFFGNKADYNGGAMYNDGSSNGNSNPVLSNVTFSANKADYYGGAMYNDGHDLGNSNPLLTNVTFSANKAEYGGAIFNDGSSDGNGNSTLTNVILWGNDASAGVQMFNYYADVTVASSLIEGGIAGVGIDNDHSSVTDGGGNLAGGPADDPLFVEPVSAGSAPTTAGNLRLQFGSPAIDVGSNSAITLTTDLDGNPRKQDGNGDGNVVVDLGAYEAPAYYVLTLATSGSDGAADAEPAGRACTSPCAGLYPVGTAVTLTATAGLYSDFSAWSGDVVSTSNPITVTMDSAKAITASFTLKEYPLDVTTMGAGSVSKEPDLAEYPHGTAVVLTANAYTYSLFSAWSGDVDISANPITVTMTGQKSVVAYFTLKEYPLDVAIVGAGSVSKEPDLAAYPHGTAAILTANANAGSVFSAWSGDVASAANPLGITMDAARTITATFVDVGSVYGVVVSGDGKPIEGVVVVISNELPGINAESTLIETTDATGNYRFNGLLPGSYTLIFSKLCYATPDPVVVQVKAKHVSKIDNVVMVWTGGETSTLFLPAAQNAP